MKYDVGDKFILKTSLGDKLTKIVNIKYEFADYIKGGPKYVSEEELEGYLLSGVLSEPDENPLDASEEDMKKVIKYIHQSSRKIDGEISIDQLKKDFLDSKYVGLYTAVNNEGENVTVWFDSAGFSISHYQSNGWIRINSYEYVDGDWFESEIYDR